MACGVLIVLARGGCLQMTGADKQPLELCFLGTGNAFAPQRY
jgi:hypothetical protein